MRSMDGKNEEPTAGSCSLHMPLRGIRSQPLHKGPTLLEKSDSEHSPAPKQLISRVVFLTTYNAWPGRSTGKYFLHHTSSDVFRVLYKLMI